MKKKLIVGALVPEIKLGNPNFNAEKIIEKLLKKKKLGQERLEEQ